MSVTQEKRFKLLFFSAIELMIQIFIVATNDTIFWLVLHGLSLVYDRKLQNLLKPQKQGFGMNSRNES